MSERDESTSDAELVCAVRKGDKQAFVQIVARHQGMVCGVALGILADFAASEDVAQHVFLKAWRDFHLLREPDRLRSWLARMAHNVAIDHLRRRRGDAAIEEALDVADQSPGPDEIAANEDEALAGSRSLLRRTERNPYEFLPVAGKWSHSCWRNLKTR